MQVQLPGEAPSNIPVPLPSPLAENLVTAIVAAGAATCSVGGNALTVANMTVSGAGVQFDDVSQYETFGTPNMVVHGADATNLLKALEAAGISDCSSERYLTLECNLDGDGPACSYQWMALAAVGSSEALPVCFLESPPAIAEGTIGASASLALWQSILTAANDTGFQAQSGTLAQVEVLQAMYFTWDGSNLAFTMNVQDGVPPP